MTTAPTETVLATASWLMTRHADGAHQITHPDAAVYRFDSAQEAIEYLSGHARTDVALAEALAHIAAVPA